MTKGPLEILSHYRTNAHLELVKEHRIRMETPGVPLYDKYRVNRYGSEICKGEGKARVSHSTQAGRLLPPCWTTRSPTVDGHKTTRQRDALTAHSPQDRTHPWRQFRCLIALWHDLVQETKTTEPISQYDWQPHRVLVGIVSFIN